VTRQVIADTGAIVALVDKREAHHAWATEQAALLLPPLFTCEAVITEASYLLRHVQHGQSQLMAFIVEGFLQTDFSLSAEIAAVAALMKKYEDVPMSLADACLVRMSELHERVSVFTIDSDFRIYRRNGRDPIPLIIPDAA
jgi:uncharacterized protein